MAIVAVIILSGSGDSERVATDLKDSVDKGQQESDPQDPMPVPNIPGWRAVIKPTTLGRRGCIS